MSSNVRFSAGTHVARKDITLTYRTHDVSGKWSFGILYSFQEYQNEQRQPEQMDFNVLTVIHISYFDQFSNSIDIHGTDTPIGMCFQIDFSLGWFIIWQKSSNSHILNIKLRIFFLYIFNGQCLGETCLILDSCWAQRNMSTI